MDAFVDRTELLHRLDRAYRHIQSLLAPLTPEQLQTPGVVGSWSVKDVIAHFIAHEQFALRELRQARDASRAPSDEPDTTTINERAVAEYQHQSVAVVVQAWETSFQEVVAAISALSVADFDPTGPIVARLGDTIDGTFGNNTYDHYAEHMPAIEAWIQRVLATKTR